MGLLSEQTSQVPDLQCAPEGLTRLVVEDAEEKVAQTGRPMLALTFSLPEHENAMNIYHNVNAPKEGDKDKTRDAMLRGIREFKKSLGFGPDDDVATETLIGLECWAFINQEEYKGRLQNKIVRFTYSQADEADAESETTAEDEAEATPA